jgi:hypothetical protein
VKLLLAHALEPPEPPSARTELPMPPELDTLPAGSLAVHAGRLLTRLACSETLSDYSSLASPSSLRHVGAPATSVRGRGSDFRRDLHDLRSRGFAELMLCGQPIIPVVTVFSAALLVEFVGASLYSFVADIGRICVVLHMTLLGLTRRP